MLTPEQQQQVQEYLKNRPTTQPLQSGGDLRSKIEKAYIQKEAQNRLPQQKKQGLLSKTGDTVEKAARFLAPKSVEGFGETLGTALATPMLKKQEEKETEENMALQDMVIKRLQDPNISKEQKERLARVSQELGISTIGQVGAVQKTARDIGAEALGTLGTIAIGATPASGLTAAKTGTFAAKVGAKKATTNLIGRLGMATAFGTGSGTKKALEEDRNAFQTATSAVRGGAIGFTTGLFFEGIMKGIKKVAPLFGKNTYNKELQPNANELASSIKRNADTFGEKVRNVKNSAGKPVYKGTYKTLLQQAKNEVSTNGGKLNSLLKQADKIDNFTINKNQAAGSIIKDLQNQYGTLTTNQIKTVKMFVNKMPNEMSRVEMLKNKRFYDGLMSKTDWSKIILGDTQASFAGQVKYILRDNLKKAIENSTDDVIVKGLNSRMGVGMEVRDLVAKQLANRVKMKVQASGMNPLSRLISRIWDDVLFNPAVTTRGSQVGSKLGEITPGLATQATEFGVIEGLQ